VQQAKQLKAQLIDATHFKDFYIVHKELESTIHDLESANDELTAANEEAMSVNEELQSTNEELETSKEELQSLNEELTALNSQLQETLERQRTTSNDLQNVLYSTNVATLFLDINLNIRFFTPAATLARSLTCSMTSKAVTTVKVWSNGALNGAGLVTSTGGLTQSSPAGQYTIRTTFVLGSPS